MAKAKLCFSVKSADMNPQMAGTMSRLQTGIPL